MENSRSDKRHMYFRITLGALTRRRSRLMIALASVIVGAAIVSGMSSVYFDIGNKMSKELRRYGANLVVLPATSSSNGGFRQAVFEGLARSIPSGKLVGAAPYLYDTADAISGTKSERLVVAGTDFEEARKTSPYWKIKGKLLEDEQATLVGIEVAEKLGLSLGGAISLKPVGSQSTSGKTTEATKNPPCLSCHQDALDSPKMHSLLWADLRQCTSCHQAHPLAIAGENPGSFKVAGILSTGGAEDGQIFVSLKKAQALFGKPKRISAAYLSVVGQASEIEQLAKSIKVNQPALLARPIKRISQSEGRILLKTGSLLLLIAVVILFSTALCVAITTVAMTLERRREIGLKKALGADDRDIVFEFLREGVLLGLIGGAAGWVAGFLFAQWIGQSVFESAISLRPVTIPLTLLISLAVTAVASLAPVRIATRIDPAVVLKEE